MCLNVGGRKHWVMSKHFVHFPGTRLGRLTRAKTVKEILEHCDKYFPGKIPEYFFCHDWMGFNLILNESVWARKQIFKFSKLLAGSSQ